MAARTPNTGSRLRTSARVGSCLPITRSPPRAIQRIAPPWQSSWASAARRAKPTEPVGVGGVSIGETSRAQAEPTSDDLTGGEPMPDKAWEEMTIDEKLEQLRRQHGQEIADLRYK